MNDFLKRDARAIRALDAAANRRHRLAMANDADERSILHDVLREALKADLLAGDIRLMLLGQRSNYSNSTLAGLNSVQTKVYQSIGSVIAIGKITGDLSTLMGDLVGDIRSLISAMKRKDEKTAIAETKNVISSADAVAKSARKLMRMF